MRRDSKCGVNQIPSRIISSLSIYLLAGWCLQGADNLKCLSAGLGHSAGNGGEALRTGHLKLPKPAVLSDVGPSTAGCWDF